MRSLSHGILPKRQFNIPKILHIWWNLFLYYFVLLHFNFVPKDDEVVYCKHKSRQAMKQQLKIKSQLKVERCPFVCYSRNFEHFFRLWKWRWKSKMAIRKKSTSEIFETLTMLVSYEIISKDVINDSIYTIFRWSHFQIIQKILFAQFGLYCIIISHCRPESISSVQELVLK